MVGRLVKYSKGIKYYTRERVFLQTSIFPDAEIKTEWLTLRTDGMLIIEENYMWDGPSGPTIDTDNSMTPSLGHDALAQLMRLGLLDRKWRIQSNVDFERWLKERKMAKPRRWFWKRQLDRFGAPSTEAKNKRRIYEVF